MEPKNECLGCSYCGTKDDIDCDLYCWFDSLEPTFVGTDYEHRDTEIECPIEHMQIVASV